MDTNSLPHGIASCQHPYYTIMSKKLFRVELVYQFDRDTYFYESCVYADSGEIAEKQVYDSFRNSTISFDAVTETTVEEIPLGI